MALKDPTMRCTPVLSALAVASTLALAAFGEAPRVRQHRCHLLGHQHCDD